MNSTLQKTVFTLCVAITIGTLKTSAQQLQPTQLFAVGVAPNTNTPASFIIDRSTGEDTPVGALGDADTLPFGLAVSNGVLYTFDGNTDQLRQIDPFTGAYTGTPINIGIGNLTGEGDIAFGAGGVGYITTAGVGATGATPQLYSFRLDGGTSTRIGTTRDALGPITVDGLAFNRANGRLYAITAEDSQLYTLNPSNGVLTPVGELGVAPASGFGALTFDNGTLYGVINDGLYNISTATGVATPVGPSGGLEFGSVSGLAVVPEPSTTMLMALGCAMLLRRRRNWFVPL